MKINWNGKIVVNGDEVQNGFDLSTLAGVGKIVVELFPTPVSNVKEEPIKEEENAPVVVTTDAVDEEQEYRITVKPYMTKPSVPGFDFMAKWNGNIPMPLRMMTGVITKATRGMVYMELHGDMYAEVMCTCMKCGKVLTNPVSQFFGIGPECGGHNYVHPFNSDEELKAAVEQYRSQLQQTQWEGWIPKSAITKMEKV